MAGSPDPFAAALDAWADPVDESRWFCDRTDCQGEPHAGKHWCEHPLVCPVHGPGPHPTSVTETCPTCHSMDCRHARANQHPPPEFARGEVNTWLLMAGRGFGKSRAAGECFADLIKRHPGKRWAVMAPKRDDVETVCFEQVLLPAFGLSREFEGFNKSKLQLRLPDGSVVLSYTPASPDVGRGPNLAGVWVEEIGHSNWGVGEAWKSVLPSIRVTPAKVVIATTPKPTPFVKSFATRDDGTVAVTYGRTLDNAANLGGTMIDELTRQWAGTRFLEQELEGKLLEDVPGALWQAAIIEATRGVLLP